MARLAAKEKLLFYPTPESVIDLIISNIEPSAGRGTIIDPCAGDGKPVSILADRLNLDSYGIEIHPERARQAGGLLTHCLNGPREFVETNGKFDVVFDNPPYDFSLSGNRMELDHLKLDIELLDISGLGIWVVPESAIDFEFCRELTTKLSSVFMRRFPSPEYDQFKQVVIFGKKRYKEISLGYYNESLVLQKQIEDGLPVLSRGEFAFNYPTAAEVWQFTLMVPDVHTTIEEVAEHGIETSDAWQSLMVPSHTGLGVFRPVLPLSAGHTAFAIAGGIVDGTKVFIDGKPHLIKGITVKEIVITRSVEATGESSVKETVSEKERLSQTLTAFNLIDGSLLKHNSLKDQKAFSDFLLTHQGDLVESIERNYPPLFVPERDMLGYGPIFNKIHAPGVLPGQLVTNGLLPAQRVRAAALAELLKVKKSAILVGEMGTGKTAMSQAIMAMGGKGDWKLGIICPAQVCEKWKRESEKVLREYGVNVHIIGQKRKQSDGKGKKRKIARPVLDVQRAMTEKSPSLLIMSYETAKNSNRWQHALRRQKKLVTREKEVETVEKSMYFPYERIIRKKVNVTEHIDYWCCPDCGVGIIPAGTKKITKQAFKSKMNCKECGAQLWQQIPFAYGGRTAIADYLNRHHAGRFSLIIDECHKTKGGDTDIGAASMDLISAAKSVIAMTGTIYGGKASSIFYLLYRLFPNFRKLYQHNEVKRFVAHHGLQETITTRSGNKNRWNSTYGYSKERVKVREIPGVTPGMVTMLLGNSAFIKLSDMEFDLPEYREIQEPVALDRRLEGGLEQLGKVFDSAVKYMREGKPSLLSAWLYASLGWIDCPVKDVLIARDEYGQEVERFVIDGVLASADEVLDEPLEKDAMLVDYIASEIEYRRGCGVFFSQVNRRDWMERIHKQLAAKGIYSEILRQSTCKVVDRESWYHGFVQRCKDNEQQPVLLTNGNLVKEGLDLIELPTIIETGIEYRLNDLRQRDRRSWRLTQNQDVDVVFMYYENSPQEAALKLVAAKLKAARLVDGDRADGLAELAIDDGNLMDELIKAVSGKG